MTLTKDITAKFAVAAVAVAMIFSAYAPAAQAQTTEDLQQMINDLLAQVAELQAQAGGEVTTGGTAGSAVCPYTWTRDLTQGSEGADVMKLQQFLNETPDLRVAPAGSPGSAGMETMYYGPATAAAVSKMQVMFRAEVLTPVGLVNPTGYFGPSSRAKANALCESALPVDDMDDEDGMEDEDEDEEDEITLGGVGILSEFEMDDEEDEVEEGSEDEVVATLTVEADNGDLEVSRMYFTLASDGNNDENDAYDAFEEVSLWVDGDKIASFDASDEDDYLDEDDGTFLFSNLGLILMEDEEVEILVAVSVNNTVRGSENMGDAEWTLEATEVRYFDADGVASNDTFTGESVTFDIVREGVDDGADLEGSSNNPDSDTLLVDDESDDSDEFVVHVFDIEVDRDSGDLEVGDVYATTTITNANPAAAIAGGQADVIDGIFMTIDGETIEGDAVAGATSGGDSEGDAIALNGGSTEVQYLFEFDQDVVLEGDEDYEVEITIVFKGQDGNYVNGVTVETAVDGSIWEVEGAVEDNALDGTDTSEVHTLSSADVDVTNYGWSAGAAGTFLDFNFTVEANDEAYTVDLADFVYATSGTATTAGPVLSVSAGVSDTNEVTAGSEYTVAKGKSATFRIRWNLNGTNGDTFDANATSVAGRTVPDDAEVSPTVTRNVN